MYTYTHSKLHRSRHNHEHKVRVAVTLSTADRLRQNAQERGRGGDVHAFLSGLILVNIVNNFSSDLKALMQIISNNTCVYAGFQRFYRLPKPQCVSAIT